MRKLGGNCKVVGILVPLPSYLTGQKTKDACCGKGKIEGLWNGDQVA